MEKTRIVKYFGSAYMLAKRIEVAQSTVSRWGRWIPLKYHDRIGYEMRKIRNEKRLVEEALREAGK